MSHKRYKDQILLNIIQVCGGGESILSLRNFYKYLSSLPLRYGTQAIQRPDTLQYFASLLSGEANKTQIVHSCNLNFHTVVPYLDLLLKNGLPERLEGENCSLLKTQGGATAAIAPSGALEMGT